MQLNSLELALNIARYLVNIFEIDYLDAVLNSASNNIFIETFCCHPINSYIAKVPRKTRTM